MGKIEPEVSVLILFFLSGAEEELEEFKGKDFAFFSEWLTKKCIAFLKVCMKSREYLNVNDFRFY